MRKLGMVTAAVLAGAAALGVAGRGGRGGDQSGGTITGKVKFSGTKPAMPAIDMSEEATCKAKYPSPPHEETVVVNGNGTLANVFVYVKAGLPAGNVAPPSTAPVIDQNGCRYHPHVFGMLVGQTLQIKNSDGILHNIKAIGKKNRPFNVSEPTSMTMPAPRPFTAPEVMLKLECSVHGWMNAYVGVLPHSFFSVTGADGSFTIKGLPPGTYTIEAWHEKYGTQTATVTVTAGAPKTQDFTFAAH